MSETHTELGYVTETEVDEDGIRVSFQCPLCDAPAEDYIPNEWENPPRHGCAKTQTTYPLVPTVSIRETPLNELDKAEQLDMQLESVDESFELVQRYRTTSKELLFSLPAAVLGGATAILGIVNGLLLTGGFPTALQENFLLLGTFLFTLVALAIGIIAVAFGTYSTLITTYNLYRQGGGQLEFLSFVGAVGNYYATDPFRVSVIPLFFLYPSWKLRP